MKYLGKWICLAVVTGALSACGGKSTKSDPAGGGGDAPSFSLAWSEYPS